MVEPTHEPPSYDGYGFESLVVSSNAASDLPAYTRRPTPPPPTAAAVPQEPREFSYEIKTRSGTPWAKMTIQGNQRLTGKVVPTMLEGDKLKGRVTLSLASAETIQAVCVLIKGSIVDANASGPVTQTPFLQLKHTLWSASEGDPNGSAGAPKVKLKGEYEWPLSISLPAALQKAGKTYSLPHTFLDRIAAFSVRYTAELRVVRGKLRMDDKVMCVFGYFSMCQPDPPSLLRQLAYQENSPLLGPEADPEGWLTQEFSCKGIVFSSRMINVKCTFSLATPLCYTRSASIPCSMMLESQDLQALDLIASPAACIVYLERVMHDDTEGVADVHEPCGQAVFWPSTEGAATDSASSRRHLMGEIHLKISLQPSSAVPSFSVNYSVVVFPFQAPAFKPLETTPIFRQPVQIVTRYAAGPRQRVYSTPSYENRNAVVDYYYYSMVLQNRTIGRRRG
ncbi:hypothetical protein FB45DRAFT_918187 [Roridomyces roridus]|uniref:Arrestin-like N-terminal domain-containing protein n=1 Tax=Roridomyces roridus TaxID=1738132 RepID=A0AAD7BQV9_9AGAR|nr:hypothetical protein FB45DRAFT_918187 [Roridomyces roridus]